MTYNWNYLWESYKWKLRYFNLEPLTRWVIFSSHHILSVASRRGTFIISDCKYMTNTGCYSPLNCRYQLIRAVIRNGNWGETYLLFLGKWSKLPSPSNILLTICDLPGIESRAVNSSDTDEYNIYKVTSEGLKVQRLSSTFKSI